MKFKIFKIFKIKYNLTPDRIVRIFFLYITTDLTLTYFGIFQTEFRDFLSRYSIAIPLHITFYYWGKSEQAANQNQALISRVQEKTYNALGEIETHLARLKRDVSEIKKENKILRERISTLLDLLEEDESEE